MKNVIFIILFWKSHKTYFSFHVCFIFQVELNDLWAFKSRFFIFVNYQKRHWDCQCYVACFMFHCIDNSRNLRRGISLRNHRHHYITPELHFFTKNLHYLTGHSTRILQLFVVITTNLNRKCDLIGYLLLLVDNYNNWK